MHLRANAMHQLAANVLILLGINYGGAINMSCGVAHFQRKELKLCRDVKASRYEYAVDAIENNGRAISAVGQVNVARYEESIRI